jgi:hypothetical protein
MAAPSTGTESGRGSRVLVAVRVRPLSAAEVAAGAIAVAGVNGVNGVTLVDPIALQAVAHAHAAAGTAVAASWLPRRQYAFDRVYGATATQQRVYGDVGARMVEHAWAGYNVSAFA